MGGRLGGEVFLGWAEPAGGKEGEEKGVLWMPRLRQVEGQSEQSPVAGVCREACIAGDRE